MTGTFVQLWCHEGKLRTERKMHPQFTRCLGQVLVGKHSFTATVMGGPKVKEKIAVTQMSEIVSQNFAHVSCFGPCFQKVAQKSDMKCRWNPMTFTLPSSESKKFRNCETWCRFQWEQRAHH